MPRILRKLESKFSSRDDGIWIIWSIEALGESQTNSSFTSSVNIGFNRLILTAYLSSGCEGLKSISDIYIYIFYILILSGGRELLDFETTFSLNYHH